MVVLKPNVDFFVLSVFGKIKDDHPVLAYCQYYWIGWVNALSCCWSLRLRLFKWSRSLFSTQQQRSFAPKGETSFNPWGLPFHDISVKCVPLDHPTTLHSICLFVCLTVTKNAWTTIFLQIKGIHIKTEEEKKDM